MLNPRIALPPRWNANVRTGLLHAISLAHFGITVVRGWCANSSIARVRLASENERLKAEVALLREELRIKDGRVARISARERPHFPPTERRAILALMQARGWTPDQTARRFVLTPATRRQLGASCARTRSERYRTVARTCEPVPGLRR